MNFDQVVNGIPLVLVVMGLVELSKTLGAEGKLLTIVSFVIGLVLGILYQLSIAPPMGFGGWFAAVVFGLALGLTASKVYDAIRSASKIQG
jgi:hypothetical protein